MRLLISYHIFNSLAKLLIGYLTRKSGEDYYTITFWIGHVMALIHLKPTLSESTKVDYIKMSNILGKVYVVCCDIHRKFTTENQESYECLFLICLTYYRK